MGYRSPLLTPECTPIRPEIVESSAPWSDILLEELQTALQFNSPSSRSGYRVTKSGPRRMRLRNQNRILWLSILVIVGVLWALHRGKRAIEDGGKLAAKPKLQGLQFIDANHPSIRYVGRWASTVDGTHKDGTFPGVYFDFALNGSKTVLLALHNTAQSSQLPIKRPAGTSPSLAFLPITNVSSATPISLLARVDDDEYIVLPNATSIVSINRGNLDPNSRHDIRIIAPMISRDNSETLQVEGLWIDEGGQLLPYETSTGAEGNLRQGHPTNQPLPAKPKMLEIVTDLLGSKAGNERHKNIGMTREILGGVMGWEYLLGEMFGSDHVTIGMNGMCLIRDCIGGTGSPIGLADVFFQSGPVGSEQYAHPWLFQDYVPDVIVMNIGNSDWDSFQTHNQQYNKTVWELSVSFEETYIAMIKSIRTLAYPTYSTATIEASRYVYSPQSAGAGIPIFIMRPFRGQLEQATHSVVDRLRKEGDKTLFWVDTNGWLNTEIHFDGRAEDQDFFLDEQSPSKQWRLTERGNQRVAILLHMHVCRYLAREVDKCAFLQPEIYQGKAIDHEALRFDEFLEDERERKLKKLFWD